MRINAFIGEKSSREIYKENDLIYNPEEMGTMKHAWESVSDVTRNMTMMVLLEGSRTLRQTPLQRFPQAVGFHSV